MQEDPAQILVYRTTEELELNAAEEIVRVMAAAIRDRGLCFIAMAGGETPRKVYRQLGIAPLRDRVDWRRVHLFFSDERVVPPTDPQSNFGMVDRELISHVNLPEQNVHRIKGELDPEKAAEEYERAVKAILDTKDARFDLVLLGLGEDGHTASLFPVSEVDGETSSWVGSVYVPQLLSWRVTLTLRCINEAREVLFLVSGGQKAAIVQRVLGLSGPTKELPATMVRPTNGKLIWNLDEDAAALLKSRSASS
jgi:6-phosphogluconolactonase